MAIQRADTFTRANVASGFGTATDGNVWTINAGNAESVASNEGVINGSSASTYATLGASLATADAEVVIRFTLDDQSDTAGVLARYTDTNNLYLARYDGAGHIAFFKNVAGVKTTVGSYAFTANTGGVFWWLKFHVQGTTISIRTWQDGTSEPATWNYTTTDTSLSGASGGNKVGLYGFSNFGPDKYDHFTADDLVASTHSLATPTRAQYRSRAALSGPARSHFLVESALTQLLTTGHAVWRNRAALDATTRATFRVNGPTAGTGIGDITRSTGTQTANKSGNGYGVGDITGTAHDYSYKDATGSGWAIEANPWYGGMPASGWYQLDPTLNTTLPQRTSLTGNQMSLLTTQSGGIVHWEEDGPGGFQASELPTFANAGNFSELAPANTPFRAYLKAIGDAADANGISWTAYMCVYPGDPGLVVFRFDQHNGTGSAISVDESDIEVIASLLTDTGSPAGAWKAANGFIGTIGGATINGWPADSVHQAGTFDFMGITPDASSGLTLGTGAAVLIDPSVNFGWTAGGYEAHITAAGATPGRIKIGWYSDVSSTWSIPAGQTNTYYVLRVFRRNLTSADMAAIAADFKFPGTPTTTQGAFTSFSVDERAYVFAAAGGSSLSATLDMSPAHVTTRYKPIVKITNWTDSNAPTLAWGGVTLVAGADYRWVYDAANQTLYLQLYFDLVTSGATTGQRNNAALSVQGLRGLATTLRTRQEIRTGAGFSTHARFATRAPLAGAARSRFVSRAALASQSRARWVIRAALVSIARAENAIRTGLASVGRARFSLRVAALATAARSRFTTRAALATVSKATFRLRSTLTQLAVALRAPFVTRAGAMGVSARSRFALRFGLAHTSRAHFLTRLSAAARARTYAVTRMALDATTRASFGLRTNLTQLVAAARSRFTTRAALTTKTRGGFFARHTLQSASRARYATRHDVGLTARARFALRFGLATPTRAVSRIGLALRAVTHATYRTFGAFALAARTTFLVKALGLGWHGPGAGSGATTNESADVSATQDDLATVSATADDRAKITVTVED